MATHTVLSVKLPLIDANPYRNLVNFPYDEGKLAALMQSIAEVGLWPAIIGRQRGERIQIAFGHHRIEAARRQLGKQASVSIIVMSLTDKQMLEYMGRENLEDFNAHFLTMLETWEGAIKFFASAQAPVRKLEGIEIAKLLGWVRVSTGDTLLMKPVAEACYSAERLIAGGHLSKHRLRDLTVDSVQRLCGSIVAQHRALDEMAKQTKRSPAEVKDAKRIVSRAGGRVADQIRKGNVAPKEIRGAVEVEAYRDAREAKKQTPLFARFGTDVANRIGTMLKDDSAAEKLQEIKGALGQIETQEDLEIVDRIAFECKHLAQRSAKWEGVFSDPKKRVVALRRIEGGKSA